MTMARTATSPRKITANDAVRKLDQFYRQGSQALKRWKEAPGKYARGAVKEQAAKLHCSVSQVFAARRLAERIDSDELKDFRRLMVRHGNAVSVCHLRALATIRTRELRWEYVRRMLDNHWSVRQLRAEIQKEFPRRGRGGRRFQLPPERKALLEQMQRMCAQFTRYSAGLEAPLDKDERTSLSELPKPIVKAHRNVLAAMKQLEAQIAVSLSKGKKR